jgi:hypothetical protein
LRLAPPSWPSPFFRDTARAQPQTSRQKLGTALVVLAQSRLATADIESATAAAVAASELVGPDDMPPEAPGADDVSMTDPAPFWEMDWFEFLVSIRSCGS